MAKAQWYGEQAAVEFPTWTSAGDAIKNAIDPAYKLAQVTAVAIAGFWTYYMHKITGEEDLAPVVSREGDRGRNVDRLLGYAQNNPSIFSKAALGIRKQGQNGGTTPPWLSDYLKDSYVPKPSDFRRLRTLVNQHRTVYNARYRYIRRKWFAHRELADANAASELFAKTNMREMQRMVTFLGSLHDALWGLFVNGHKPVLQFSDNADIQ